MTRKGVPLPTVIQVLTEAGFRCAVPTCRNILALDLHHIVEVAEGGANDPSNLLPLCPTCHALYHRGTIPRESIYTWKAVLVSLSHAFDTHTIDDLLFLGTNEASTLRLSGDGVLKFSRLIASGLATFYQVDAAWAERYYAVSLTAKGEQLISAWKAGNRDAVARAISGG